VCRLSGLLDDGLGGSLDEGPGGLLDDGREAVLIDELAGIVYDPESLLPLLVSQLSGRMESAPALASLIASASRPNGARPSDRRTIG
jgi:hypothetical protein